jgi:hypothetical protein
MFIGWPHFATCGTILGSFTATKLHGCELHPEGASLAASKHFVNFSRSTGLPEKFLQL